MVNVSWDVKKINSVYNMNGGGEKGIQALYKEIAQLVGFEPDYQVIVEWEAVGKIVDAIGGVYFDVPYDMNYHDPYQDLVIEQAKGYRLLNGDDAMQVIRWRKNDDGGGVGDEGRMKIQQDFLKAVIKQLMTPANVLNIGKISAVFQESVETDLSFQEILWFGQQAVSGGLSVENVEFMTMPWYGAGAWSRSYNQNLSYVIPKANDLLELVNSKLSPFVDPFVLSDLDLMSVNSDGSLRSTTGYVEDSKAALPPVKPVENDVTETLDENGNIVDPETGESLSGDGGMIVIDPATREEESGNPMPDAEPEEDSPVIVEPEPTPEEPGDTHGNEGTTPETPVVPAEPEEFETPGFSIIEPPPAA
jgi:LCP family protein required for cell wall assembly